MSEPIIPSADTLRPDLRIVPTERVIPHEHHDWQRVEPLAERLKADGTLMNPPVVADLGDTRYIVLDGANRVTALSRMGTPHCLVQVVPYEPPFVELHTWHHAISDMAASELDAQIAATKGLTASESDLPHAQASLARRALLSYYIRADGSAVILESSANLHSRAELLNKLVSIYATEGRLHRTHSTNIEELKALFPGICALVIFPSFTPAEVLELAGSDAKLPPGITRHIIHGRVLRVNYPLEALQADDSLEAKNAALANWIQDKLDKRRVRFYAESAFLFDE
jgi:hypothetical protein